MTRFFVVLVLVVTFGQVPSNSATADPGAEIYLDRAEQVLHHSCRSLVEVAGEDPTQIEMVLRSMVAVSLYNREINVADYAKTDDELKELKSTFIDAIRSGCEEDSDALLAGVVDRAVVYALTDE